ncbi:hypothetical protein CL654_01290 [bacterium]|nr:hypothetical protein [bacterium]
MDQIGVEDAGAQAAVYHFKDDSRCGEIVPKGNGTKRWECNGCGIFIAEGSLRFALPVHPTQMISPEIETRATAR